MSEEYYRTKESVEEYVKLAEGYNGSELIIKLKGYLPQNSKLLEIGSGPGTDYEILRKEFDVIGSDFSTEFLKRLISKYSNKEFLELNAATLKTELKFDGIYSNKVLHHLKDEELLASIKKQNDILNTNGVICHSFWKGNGSDFFKGLFVNYHSNKEIENLFSSYFDILILENYEEMDTDDSTLLIGKKKQKI